MTQVLIRQCVWCTKEFVPSQSANDLYNLPHGALLICFDCSDKWEDIEVRLHDDKLNGFLDETFGVIRTITGHVLPINIVSQDTDTAKCVDDYGHHWLCKRIRGKLCTLIPKTHHKLIWI